MKVKIINIALAAILAASALTACADAKPQSDGFKTDSTASQTAAQTPATEETEATAEPAAAEIDYAATANELFGAFNQIDRLGGTAVPYDETVTYTEGEEVFYLLPKMPYTSVADLKEYMESYLTEEMISSRYSNIIGGDNPLYIDHDGQLYVRPNAKGCGFAFYEENNEPVISNQSESSFTAQMDYDNFGEKSTLEIEVVKDGELWKINSFNIK